MLAGQLAPSSANLLLKSNNLQAASHPAIYFEDGKLQHEKQQQQFQQQQQRRRTSMTTTTTTTASSCTTAAVSPSPASITPTQSNNNNNSSSSGTLGTAVPTATSPKPPVVGAATKPSTRDHYYRDIPSPRNRTKDAVGDVHSRCSSDRQRCNDASGRSAALERAYVHDVYENCEEPSGPVRPKVAQFLAALDPGSVVCDVGCGSGRYLTQCNPSICTIGVDRCHRLSKVAREKGGEVAVCDNLELPFRDESFDAVLSLAVVHHFATTERRVGAIRELARILRIGGRVIISVWALEQRHRRFESQDVLIPWQPPKNRNQVCSDEEDDDDILPPYNAYTEESTNSSRSAGDGDSSSLSSSSPGESCYSFVRRAIQKLAGSKRHPWFLDSWTSKDTKNNSSLDYEDAKDLPIELRRLEDFEDFPDPPLSASLKSRSLGSILNPPPRQIVRSRSSVPSLGAQIMETKQLVVQVSPGQMIPTSTAVEQAHNNSSNHSPGSGGNTNVASGTETAASTPPHSTATSSRRPKLIKQKQSLCDDDYQLPDNPFHMISNCSSNNSLNSSSHPQQQQQQPKNGLRGFAAAKQLADAKMFLRKQSSLNEELMAGNRIREKERVRKRIQKQMSLNEAFLCRSVFTKRLQVLRDGFTNKLKTSTGSLERVTKNGFVKIMQNFKATSSPATSTCATTTSTTATRDHHHHHHHAHHSSAHRQASLSSNKSGEGCNCGLAAAAAAAAVASLNNGNEDQSSGNDNKPRRHSRESGSDSSKDSSLQSDTSIESEDSFASVIFIPKPELQQQQAGQPQNPSLAAQKHQQQIYHQQNSNSSSSNSSSSCNGAHSSNCNTLSHNNSLNSNSRNRLPSVPTSPLIMPCPPTPAHSPAAAYTVVTSPPQTMSAVQAAMAMLTPPKLIHKGIKTNTGSIQEKSRFTFEDEHIQQLESSKKFDVPSVVNGVTTIVIEKPEPDTKASPPASKITRQTIKDLPPIPKFRKQQSLHMHKPGYAIVRRTSAATPSIPKFMSLELFNPATDDLDSDSSEPSSPDSIDSVISAPKSAFLNGTEPDEPTVVKDDIFKSDLHVNGDGASMENLNLDDDSMGSLPYRKTVNKIRSATRQECVDFAEQLSAQLLRELDDKNRSDKTECRSLDGIGGDIGDYIDDPVMANFRKRNGDLAALRDELRERRLMLANLSTQPSLQQSPNSSSTSSLSSQTRSLTIHEEDEEEEREEAEGNSSNSYSLNLYDNYKISKFKYKRNRQYSLNPETAYLLDDGDSSAREDDDDVILEEDEDVKSDEGVLDDDAPEAEVEGYAKKTTHNTIKCEENSLEENNKQDGCGAVANRQSTIESWEHSNSSTASLDSPSQGGATTHHRYYHVFREGELDALINHHVASLHIVSSYYERASWCVVAEKVQVWTI